MLLDLQAGAANQPLSHERTRKDRSTRYRRTDRIPRLRRLLVPFPGRPGTCARLRDVAESGAADGASRAYSGQSTDRLGGEAPPHRSCLGCTGRWLETFIFFDEVFVPGAVQLLRTLSAKFAELSFYEVGCIGGGEPYRRSLSLLLSNLPSACSKASGPMRTSPLNGKSRAATVKSTSPMTRASAATISTCTVVLRSPKR